MPTLKKQRPVKVHKPSDGYPFKVRLPNPYNYRNLTPSEISVLENREYWRMERLGYNKKGELMEARAKREAENEASLQRTHDDNEKQISHGQATRRMKMEDEDALQQRDESLRKQREEKNYANFIDGTMPHSIGPKDHAKFADTKRRTETRKKGLTKRAELFKNFRKMGIPIQPESRSRSASSVEMDTGGSNFRISKSSRYTKKSKTAKKRKNKRKTMRY